MKQWTPEERLDLISEISASMAGYIVRKRYMDTQLSYTCADVILAIALYDPIIINTSYDRIEDVLEQLEK